jgi:uncharacterized membrane protein (DUF485 family)
MVQKQRGDCELDPTPKQAEQAGEAPPEQAESGPTDAKPWSPFSTRTARWSWGLMAIFTTIYFAVAILTSAEFADLAATMILGLPLGFYLGIGLIISGLVITRIYLSKVEG